MNRKIVCVTMDYAPKKGGVARYLSSLKKHFNGGMEVIIPADFDVKEQGVLKKKFWGKGWPRWWPLVNVFWGIADDKILLISHVFPIGTAVWLVSFFKKKRYIVLFHGTDIKRVQSKWKKFLLNRICQRAELLIVNSKSTRSSLERLIKRRDVMVITPGIESWELFDKYEARRKLGLGNEKIVLSVGRLVSRKGFDLLLNVAGRLKTDGEKFKLVIIGDGPQKEVLINLGDILGLDIFWAGKVGDEELKLWYSAGDLFVLAGREEGDDVEGFGMVFLEASQSGLSILAGDNGGVKEAVLHNKTGLVVKPEIEEFYQSWKRLMLDDGFREVLGKNGKDRVEKDFYWDERVELFKFLLGESLDLDILKEDQKDVGVVIPCYNHAEELDGTLESLSKQELLPNKVVVVDDGSNDSPEKVVDRYRGLLSIEYVRLEENQGAPRARNIGRKRLKNALILFLDADTELKSMALKDMAFMLYLHPQAGFVYSDFYWDDRLFRGRSFEFTALKKENYINTVSMVRVSVNPVFDEGLQKFQDWDLWWSLAEKGVEGVYLPRVLFKIKQRKTGISQWLPSIIYKIPWGFFGWTPKLVLKYNQAKKIIYKKHRYE